MRKMDKILSLALSANLPVHFIGKPGTGKTSAISKHASTNDLHLETLILSRLAPEDTGIPKLSSESNSFTYATPQWFMECSNKASILFLDEISSCPPANQASIQSLIQDRSLHGHKLHKNTTILAASNPIDHATNATPLAAPLANRLIHVQWESNLDEWVQGECSQWETPQKASLPENWELQIPQQMAQVFAFLRRKPEYENALPDDENGRSSAWPSRRSWTLAARALTASHLAGMDDIADTLLAGCVGESVAIEFLQFQRSLDLPEIKDCLENPSKVKLPEKEDSLYTCLISVATETLRLKTNSAWEASWTLLKRACDSGHIDVAAPSADLLIINKPNNFNIPKDKLEAFRALLGGRK